MPSDEPSFWGWLRARFPVSRAWLARGVGLLVTVALVAGFAALVWRDRAPLAAPIAQSVTPTATFVSAETFAPDPTSTPTSGPAATATPVPFVCANAPGSQSTYAFRDYDHQIYRVTGCANPVRLTNYDEKSFASPLAFSPTNRWLMVSVTKNVSDTSYPECQVLINPTNGAAVKTPLCADGGNDAWTEWPTFIAWLDDSAFLESLTHKDGTVSVVRVNATTFARSPIATLTYVANFGSMAAPSGIKLVGNALYYGGYKSKSEGGGWLHRVSLTSGADTRIVRLGATDNGGCQVGTNPCTWTGPWDVSPDGSHILYYSPGPTVGPNDYCADEAETPLYYARSDGSNPVRLFADQPLGRDFPVPSFSPDGTRVAWMVLIGKTRCTSVAHGVIQVASGGAVAALPNGDNVVSWRNDGAAVVVQGPSSAALYTLATNRVTPLPGDSYSYVWGA
ncbi:MAG TPA: hypothetical protein VH349_06560 [Ktedonobacterales bacterium]|jgi:hypothetical protein